MNLKKTLIKSVCACLLLLFNTTLFSQTDKKPIMMSKETFLQKVWNYQVDDTEWKYRGDKPCIIDFYADWCGPCRRIAPYMEEFAAKYDLYIYKVNTDQQKELAELFQARQIPMVLYVPMKGQPQRVIGALPKEQYVKMIETILLPDIKTPQEN